MADDLTDETTVPRARDIGRNALEAVGFELSGTGIADLIADLMHLADDEEFPDTDGWTAFRDAQRHYEAEKPSEDEVNLGKAKGLVRERYPEAAVMHLETSDQNSGYGFWLTGLSDAAGQPMETDDGFHGDVWEYVCNLSWGGVVREDSTGYAEINLKEGDE